MTNVILPNSAALSFDEVAVRVSAAFALDREAIATAAKRDEAMFDALAAVLYVAHEVGYAGLFPAKGGKRPTWKSTKSNGVTVGSTEVREALAEGGASKWAAQILCSAVPHLLHKSAKVRGEAANPKASAKLIRDAFPNLNTLKGVQDWVTQSNKAAGKVKPGPKAHDGAGAEGQSTGEAPAKVADAQQAAAQEPKAATPSKPEPKAPMGDPSGMTDAELELEILAMVRELASRPKGAKRIAMIGQQVEALLEAQAKPKAA